MSRNRINMAIIYDFDGTLSPGNMQEHSFIPKIGMSKKKFWGLVRNTAKKNRMDEILAYMYLMIKKANELNLKIDKHTLTKHGKKIKYFKGVRGWFNRITKYALAQGVNLKHFIISSGLNELIEGSQIHKYFDGVFASGFMYDQHNVAIWPSLAINYTTKTQYLFRINKGIMDIHGNVNKIMADEKRPFPFKNIMYIGDGETDVPCMKMVKQQMGHAIAVYDPRQRHSKDKKSAKERATDLYMQERADFVAKADYSPKSEIERIVAGIINKVVLDAKLAAMKKKRAK